MGDLEIGYKGDIFFTIPYIDAFIWFAVIVYLFFLLDVLHQILDKLTQINMNISRLPKKTGL